MFATLVVFLKYFSEKFLPAKAKAGLVMGPLRLSFHLSLRNTFGVPSLSNL